MIPSAIDDSAMSRPLARARCALASAPNNEPMPVAANISAYDARAAVERALREQRQHHLVVEREHADDDRHDDREAHERLVPRVADAGDELSALALDRHRGADLTRVHEQRARTITPANDTALITKHQPMPTVAMRMPAIDGPTMRAEVNTALLRLTAFVTSPCSTSSGTNERRAGLSNAFAVPSASASTTMIHRFTTSASTKIPSTQREHALRGGRDHHELRLSWRSAMTPAHAPNTRIGKNCSAYVSPSMAPLCVMWSTSHGSATSWIHVPTCDTDDPAK